MIFFNSKNLINNFLFSTHLIQTLVLTLLVYFYKFAKKNFQKDITSKHCFLRDGKNLKFHEKI